MSTKTALAILALASALTLTPTLGATQSAGNAPVAFSADDGEATATGVALRGRAEIVQGDNRLRADAIELTRINGEVTRATASGNVYFVTPDQNARGDQAVFNVASEEVVVTGDVILTQGRNVLTGNRVVYNTRTQDARISGGAGGRIQGVFYPEGSGN